MIRTEFWIYIVKVFKEETVDTSTVGPYED